MDVPHVDVNGKGGRRPDPGILREAGRYVLCGLGAGASDYGTFLFLTAGLGWGPLAAQSLSRLAGGLVGFMLHRTWTFRHRRGVALRVQFVRFWCVWAAVYFLALGAVWAYARLWPGHPVVAKACADGTVGLAAFLLQRHWTFARSRRPA